MSTTPRLDWPTLLPFAADIVESYSTPVTLRQLHYRLVSADIGYPNTQAAYKGLSRQTAEARRQGRFPRLHDRTREIHRPLAWDSPGEALEITARSYRCDRTAGQEYNVIIGVEKAGLLAQLTTWFRPLGLPVIALGGYSSQSFVEDVSEFVADDGRPAVLLYAGDHDPSGEDIDRDFAERCGLAKRMVRVALSAEQVEAFNLPPAFGKVGDSRSAKFVERHGRLVQVELDAVPPDALRTLYEDALAPYWDSDAYDEVMLLEAGDREKLREIARTVTR